MTLSKQNTYYYKRKDCFPLNLNTEQQQAVNTIHGPLLIMAGAGSGKTRTVIERIDEMIRQGISPYHILAITFTNKAARELRERLSPQAQTITASTIHSFCVQLLRKYAIHIGYPTDFPIMDTDDVKTVLGYIKNDIALLIEAAEATHDDPPYGLSSTLFKKLKVASVASTISKMKNEMIAVDDASDWLMQNGYFDYDPQLVENIYRRYEEYNKKEGAMDFDDLLIKTCDLFETAPNVLSLIQDQYQYITVDEYQDTNEIQDKLVNAIASKYRNLCVVGDADQSIYAFRGAKVQNIIQFTNTYPDATVINLDKNYRSRQSILDAANDVINQNPKINNKTRNLHSDITIEHKPTIVHCPTDRDEAQFVAKSIQQLHKQGVDYKDITILYRNNAQSTIFQRIFRQHQIPFVIYNAINFYQRKEIKDMIAYLQLCVNPHINLYLKRVLNKPSRKIGATAISKIEAFGEGMSPKLSLAQALSYADNIAGLQAGTKTGIKAFLDIYKNIDITSTTKPVSDVMKHIINSSGYLHVLSANATDDDSKREYQQAKDLLEEFIMDLQDFDNQTLASNTALSTRIASYLQDIMLQTSTDKADSDEDNVKLMTIHTAKGLEFPNTFVVGCENDNFPSERARSDEEMQEERRLMYVAMTRAQERLVITYADTRMKWGTVNFMTPSLFLSEITPDHAERINYTVGYVKL